MTSLLDYLTKSSSKPTYCLIFGLPHKDGGGVICITEAYQLRQANRVGGSQVLDFLLAEVRTSLGKWCSFWLAIRE